MPDVFISHVEEDAEVAQVIADGLMAAGYSAWYYEVDSLPGRSYLEQISQAIQSAQAVLIILSPDALDSGQVDKEVDFAHELNRPFLPVVRNLTWQEFQIRRPKWRMALGTSTAILIPRSGVTTILPRIVQGLQGMGIRPTRKAAPPVAEPAVESRSAPAAAQPSPVEAHPAGGADRRPEILIVDDSIMMREMARQALEHAGYAVRVTTSGAEAMAAARPGGCRAAALSRAGRLEPRLPRPTRHLAGLPPASRPTARAGHSQDDEPAGRRAALGASDRARGRRADRLPLGGEPAEGGRADRTGALLGTDQHGHRAGDPGA